MPNELDELIDFHTETYFVTDDYFGEEVVFVPRSDWSNKIEGVQALVVPDHAVGSNENRGDGVRLSRVKGSSERTSITLEFPREIPIQRTQSRQKPDLIKWDGEIWKAIRTVAYDQSMRAVLFVSSKDVISSGQSRRG